MNHLLNISLHPFQSDLQSDKLPESTQNTYNGNAHTHTNTHTRGHTQTHTHPGKILTDTHIDHQQPIILDRILFIGYVSC